MSQDLSAFLLSWQFEPTVVVGLALAAGLYARGWHRLRQRGRGALFLKPWRAWCFGGGIAALGIALLSPIATYDSLLFHMHMIQHLLLVMIAAPLILLGAPVVPTLFGLPRPWRRALGGLFHRTHPVHKVFHFLSEPAVALTLYIGVMAGWHIPALYDAAQGRTLVHDLEHVMFMGTALLYWWPLVHPTGGKRRLGYGVGILYLFPAKLEGFAIGAALTLPNTVFYETYTRVPRIWGLTALADQQLGGLIMWVWGGLLYIVPLLILVLMLMLEDEGHIWVPAAAREAAVSAEAEPATTP